MRERPRANRQVYAKRACPRASACGEQRPSAEKRARSALVRTLVAYYSATGNTKRIAQTIAKETKGKLADITKIKPAMLSNYDVIFIGTPVFYLQLPAPVKKFMRSAPKGKDYAVFYTRNLEVLPARLSARLALRSVVSEAVLWGSVNTKPNLFVSFAAFIGDLVHGKGQPDGKELRLAREWARGVAHANSRN